MEWLLFLTLFLGIVNNCQKTQGRILWWKRISTHWSNPGEVSKWAEFTGCSGWAAGPQYSLKLYANYVHSSGGKVHIFYRILSICKQNFLKNCRPREFLVVEWKPFHSMRVINFHLDLWAFIHFSPKSINPLTTNKGSVVLSLPNTFPIF